MLPDRLKLAVSLTNARRQHWREYDARVSGLLEEAYRHRSASVEISLMTDSVCASAAGGSGSSMCRYVISLAAGAFTQTNVETGG